VAAAEGYEGGEHDDTIAHERTGAPYDDRVVRRLSAKPSRLGLSAARVESTTPLPVGSRSACWDRKPNAGC
jgi:hypothetical protein